MGNGNGNNTAYAEIRVETCSGDAKAIPFKTPSFRESRREANKVLATLSLAAMSGNDIAHINDPENWFKHIPGTAHISQLTLSKCNTESRRAKLVSTRLYHCEHNTKSESEK